MPVATDGPSRSVGGAGRTLPTLGMGAASRPGRREHGDVIDSDCDPSGRLAHDLTNLVLAARLRVDALRPSADEAAMEHLRALEACLARILDVVKAARRA